MQMLERATPAYRKGYLECRAGKPKQFTNDGTFHNHDYDEGWEACWNDNYWCAVRENEARG